MIRFGDFQAIWTHCLGMSGSASSHQRTHSGRCSMAACQECCGHSVSLHFCPFFCLSRVCMACTHNQGWCSTTEVHPDSPFPFWCPRLARDGVEQKAGKQEGSWSLPEAPGWSRALGILQSNPFLILFISPSLFKAHSATLPVFSPV